MSLAPSLRPDAAAIPLQRAMGRVRARVHAPDGQSRLDRLHQSGCLKLRFPRLPGGAPEGVLINTSGGLTGGDRLTQDYEVGDGARFLVTTQAAERIYRSNGGHAGLDANVRIGCSAAFAFLPQETILFDGGRLSRRLCVDMAATSRLLLCESVILGRVAMGERLETGFFRDSWRIRREGRLVFAEDARLDGDIEALIRRRAALSGHRAFATLVAQQPDAEALLADLRALLGDAGGASLVDGLLVVRLVAPSGLDLRRRLVPILIALAKGPLPRVWSF